MGEDFLLLAKTLPLPSSGIFIFSSTSITLPMPKNLIDVITTPLNDFPMITYSAFYDTFVSIDSTFNNGTLAFDVIYNHWSL